MSPRELPRLLRTLRHLRASQVTAQLRHRLLGGVRPRRWRGPAPELTARAAVPFLGAPPHAAFDGQRRFRLLNREASFQAEVDWDFEDEGPLFAYHLHQFDYLRRPGLSPHARARLVLDWIERHPSGIGWSPHPLGLRVLSWARLLLSEDALALDGDAEARVRASLGAQLETLSRHLEVHLLANHYLSNLLALVFGGILFQGRRADRWLAFEAELREQLAEQVLVDGAHYERSPMYHALLLENVLDLLNLSKETSQRTPRALTEALADAAQRMLGALRFWTHPDGGIALFADSAHGIAQPPSVLEAYAAALGVAAEVPEKLGSAGYVRLSRGEFTLLASMAGPSPSYEPGHAHCDALAFELSVGRQRVVTDTGVTEYVSGALRDESRATRSHATLEVGGAEQAEVWAAHRVGGRPTVQLVAAGRDHAEGTCSGWSTPETVHRRVLRLDDEGLEVTDSLEGRPRTVRMTIPLAPGLDPQLTGRSVVLRLEDHRCLRLELAEGLDWRIEERPYFPEFGRVIRRAALVGRASEFRWGACRWRLSG